MDLSRDNVSEYTFSSDYQERGATELAVDDLGFFQKIDVPTALGTMDQDSDLGFWRRIHIGLMGHRKTRIRAEYFSALICENLRTKFKVSHRTDCRR
jgi:hypothetical protein